MNPSEKPDAFSRALENKPRNSHISQIKKQFEENDSTTYSSGPSVNRLSRVFESTHLHTTIVRPTPATKPPSLRPNSISKTTPPSQPANVTREEPQIDQTPLAFKDIRARFQQQQQQQQPLQNEQVWVYV